MLCRLQLFSQACTTLGQTPSTAFPVCGTSVFSQSIVPNCGGDKSIPGPCGNDGVTDTNPFWYKFTCFASGTLGFLIEPVDKTDDYDWQLFDITDHSPNDVYTNRSLFVACNWSGRFGNTGTSSSANSLENCAGDGYPTFSRMPNLIEGHNYILLVSHFTAFDPGQDGYKLSFNGGTANITDPTDPELLSASAACGGAIIRVKLNKKMKCGSLANDGSDFTITPAVGKIVSATGVNCSSGFDVDSVELTLDGPLPPGDYTVNIKKGSDANTLLDNCDRQITEGDKLSVTVYPVQPTPMDSINPVGCAPNTLQLVFNNNIRCNSIADDGSDFTVSGPTAVTVTSANGSCTGGLSAVIQLTLSTPIVDAGLYTVTLKQGSDGNTIIDECGLPTPAGSQISFTAVDTVNAAFDYKIFYGCKTDTVIFSHNGNHGVNNWQWTFDNQTPRDAQSTIMYYSNFGEKAISLIVSNGVCTDSTNATILLDNTLVAAFDVSSDLCPEDMATITNLSQAKDGIYTWTFGNGATSNSKEPAPFHYQPPVTRQKLYTINLTVQDAYGCIASASKVVRALNTCLIAVPSAFTPNSDGKNDFLYPLNAYKAVNLEFRVFNRLGQLVFFTTDWTRKWDGTYKGNPQPTGTYVWMLTYTHRDTGEKIFYKGTSVLLR